MLNFLLRFKKKKFFLLNHRHQLEILWGRGAPVSGMPDRQLTACRPAPGVAYLIGASKLASTAAALCTPSYILDSFPDFVLVMPKKLQDILVKIC
jgi:hypothetical protein